MAASITPPPHNSTANFLSSKTAGLQYCRCPRRWLKQNHNSKQGEYKYAQTSHRNYSPSSHLRDNHPVSTHAAWSGYRVRHRPCALFDGLGSSIPSPHTHIRKQENPLCPVDGLFKYFW